MTDHSVVLPYVSHKAGMDNVDKDRIQKAVERNTSAKFETFQKQKQTALNDKLEAIKEKRDRLDEAALQESKDNVEKTMRELVDTAVMDKSYVHVDMDAFFANVEMRDDPRLRTVPMAVGSNSMLSTANYVARKSGVRSAMPGFIAKDLCPELVIVPCNFEKYKQASHQVRKVLADYDSNFCSLGLDEACLELSAHMRERHSSRVWDFVQFSGDCLCRLPRQRDELVQRSEQVTEQQEQCEKCGLEEAVMEMRLRVEQSTGLTCSAGVAFNYKIAKIASDIRKPNGQFVLAGNWNEVNSFWNDLDVRKVPGIGPTTEFLLKGLAINTCKDLRDNAHLIPLLFQPCSAAFLLRCAVGVFGGGEETDESDDGRKSMSEERTFKATDNDALLLAQLEHSCTNLMRDLLKHYVGCHGVGLIVKYDDFERITRTKTVQVTVDKAPLLFKLVKEMFLKHWNRSKKVRLIGVRCSNLLEPGANRQADLTPFLRAPKPVEPDDDDVEVVSVIAQKASKPMPQSKNESRKRPSTRPLDQFVIRRPKTNDIDDDIIFVECKSRGPADRDFAAKRSRP